MSNKVAVTPANMTDDQEFKHVCPNGGVAYADKGYCLEDSQKRVAKSKNVHLVAIKKNNMKDKNRGLDRWVTLIRRSYERVFFNKIGEYVILELLKSICRI